MVHREMLDFVTTNPEAAGVIVTAVIAAIGGAWVLYRHFSGKRNKAEPGQRLEAGGKNAQTAQAGRDVTQAGKDVAQAGRDITITKGADVDVDAIVEKLESSARREGALSAQLENASQKIEYLEDLNRQLTNAVEALAAERTKPGAPPGIDKALKLLAEGGTEAAEAIFEQIKQRRKTPALSANRFSVGLPQKIGGPSYVSDPEEGATAASPITDKEAAAAARHIGALAFLHDTDKSLAAYREAVDLDPDDSNGWNQLGHLLHRTGDLDGATEAYNRVLSLGNTVEDQELIAVATGNLGLLYKTRGDLDRAEEMFRKSLELSKELGRKEGMASQYGNLGTLYGTRGDLDRAEEIFRKSLDLNEALGRKEGMASDYGNLGILYGTRGDLDRAEEMYRNSLELSKALGRKEGMASQYGNLGILYATRGDFDRAEEMHRKSLDLDEALGRKEGMASQYGNLGTLYGTRGDLDRAEEMFRKSLDLNEALGRKEGMASDYGNLGSLYATRGDLDRAEEMYRKSLDLFRELGAIPMIEKMEGWLAELRGAE